MPPKTEMFSWVSIYEGDFCHGYMCTTCEQITKFVRGTFEEGFVSEGLEKGETPEGLLSRLINKEVKIEGVL